METKTHKPEPSTKTGTVWSDMAKRVAAEFVPAQVDPPKVRMSVVESYAKKMSEHGYEMTDQSIQILTEYLKGFNIWLCGNVGVGKTYFFDTISSIRRERGMSHIKKLSMIETQGWTMEDAREWTSDYRDRDVLIDDVGAEPMLNHYGEKVEVFPYLLEKRMQLTSQRTHLTSNLGPADILKRYDRRVADRFAQMFRMIEIKAKKSRRKLAPWKKFEDGVGIL